MKYSIGLAALLGLLTAAAAHAEPTTPTATRLSIGGQPPRVYPTYGNVNDPEIYAPVKDEVGALGLRCQLVGGMAQVTVGARIANWNVTRSTASLPVRGVPATVLLVGSTPYLPLRACSTLLEQELRWDFSAGLLCLGKGPGGPGAALLPAGPVGLKPMGSGKGVAAGSPARTAATPVQPVTREQAARAALRLAAAAVPYVSPASAALSQVAARGADIAAHAVQAVPAAPPVQAVVRRRAAPVLAFRGGVVDRSPVVDAGRPHIGRLQGKVICVDAGHGGYSLGARGLGGLLEKNAALSMSLELAQALQAEGATVIMPRSDDTYVSLDDRIDFANTRGSDLFISIHCNAMPTPNTVNGTETYYYTPQSLALAQTLHPQVVSVVGERDGGIRRRGFAVIRRTVMPSVLLEIAYINHAKDEAKLADSGFRRQVGEAVADGVVRYFAGR